MRGQQRQTWFVRITRATARLAGRPWTFAVAVLMVVAWALTGPIFDWSDTWQLVINTSTTIATFLMVFLIQSTQNRDTEALQIKLDELIRATEGAHNTLLDLEELGERELDEIREGYARLAEQARQHRGTVDTGKPEVS